MFASISIFKILNGLPDSPQTLADLISQIPFVPTGPTQEVSAGWEPPRAEGGAFVEAINRQWIMRMVIETRSVPSSAVKDKAEAAAAEIENSTGRKPGKKEMRQLKEDALQALLPNAFPKRAGIMVWINPDERLLVIGSTSSSKTDEIVTALVRQVPDFTVSQINTQTSPQAAMASWLHSAECPDEIELGRSVDLKAQDESKATAKFNSHNLVCDEVRQHLAMGKLPTKMGLVLADRIEFCLDESMRITKIKLIDVDVAESKDGKAEDAFDGTVTIETAELTKLILALISALGGEMAAEASEKGSGTTPSSHGHDFSGSSDADSAQEASTSMMLNANDPLAVH